MQCDWHLERWPLGMCILDKWGVRIERIVGHLVGGWLVGKDRYTDPEIDPWVALVCEPIVPCRLSVKEHWRDADDRQHDQERLVGGVLPERHVVHAVSGSPPHSVCPVSEVEMPIFRHKFSHYPTLTVFTWPGDYLVVEEDSGDCEANEKGGEVAHTASYVGMRDHPRLASAAHRAGAQWLFDVAVWLTNYILYEQEGEKELNNAKEGIGNR